MSKKLKKAGAALMAAARMKDTGECVKVVVRCRPLNSTERGDKRNICVGMDESLGQVALQDPAQEDAVSSPALAHIYISTAAAAGPAARRTPRSAAARCSLRLAFCIC